MNQELKKLYNLKKRGSGCEPRIEDIVQFKKKKTGME